MLLSRSELLGRYDVNDRCELQRKSESRGGVSMGRYDRGEDCVGEVYYVCAPVNEIVRLTAADNPADGRERSAIGVFSCRTIQALVSHHEVIAIMPIKIHCPSEDCEPHCLVVKFHL